MLYIILFCKRKFLIHGNQIVEKMNQINSMYDHYMHIKCDLLTNRNNISQVF